MKVLLDKFRAIEAEIASERGSLALFALFEREDAPGKWDVLISAPWIADNRKSALDYIVRKINSKLSAQELVMLSRVVLLDPSDDVVRMINSAIALKQGLGELRDFNFNGMVITHAHVITSQRNEDSPAEPQSVAK